MIGLLIDLVDILRGSGRKDKALASVVVRVKHVGFVDAVRQNLARQGASVDAKTLAPLLPITRPFVGDLVIAYALDGDERLDYIGHDFLAKHRIRPDKLHEAALANTRRQIVQTLKVGQTRTFNGLDSKITGLAAAVTLFPEFWKPIEAQAGGDLVVAIPGRDFVCFLALPAAGEARRDALVRSWIMKNSAIAAFEASGNHALSEFTYRVRDGRFEQREQLGEMDEELRALLATPEGDALLARYGTV